MARSIWSGAISFGLVNVPVKLYSAVSRKSVRFHQLNGKTGVRIQQKRVDPSTGDEVAYEDIVKGYELTPDQYVVIEPDELEALDPKKTKSIEIEDFVALDEIDPLYYDHQYYLAPGPDEVIDPTTLDEVAPVEDVEINPRELEIAKQLVDSLAGPFDPDKYRDTYR